MNTIAGTPMPSSRTPEESAAIYAAAKLQIGPDKPPATPGAPLIEEFEAHLKRIRDLNAARMDALGPVGDIAIGKSASAEQWKLALPDVDGGGRWRLQSFDLDGFSGHEIYRDKDEALEAMVRHHYLRDDGALDRLQDTPRFQRGLFAADLMRKHNSGEITYSAVIEQLEAYAQRQAAASAPAAGPDENASQGTTMSQAFGISEDDVLSVLSKHWDDVANTEQSFEQLAAAALAQLDHGAIEKAALRGNDLDIQTTYAQEEIERQLRTSGVLEERRIGDLDQALTHLVRLVERGVEFPDAQWKATQRYKVDADELAEVYDNRDRVAESPRG